MDRLLLFSAWPGSGAPLSRDLEGALYKFWLIDFPESPPPSTAVPYPWLPFEKARPVRKRKQVLSSAPLGSRGKVQSQLKPTLKTHNKRVVTGRRRGHGASFARQRTITLGWGHFAASIAVTYNCIGLDKIQGDLTPNNITTISQTRQELCRPLSTNQCPVSIQ